MPDRLEGRPDPGEDSVGCPPAGRRRIVRTVVLSRQVHHVPALVPALGHLVTPGPGQQAHAEGADLSPCVVDVVLAGHLVAAAGEHPGQGVAVAAPPAIAHVDRSGRVGRDEFDLDLLAVTDVGARVALLAFGQHGGHRLVEPPVVQSEVDEAGAGQLDPDHMIGQGPLEYLDHRGGEGPWIGAGPLGGHHGDVGRPVTVLTSRRAFQVDRGRVDRQVETLLGGDGSDRTGDRVSQPVADRPVGERGVGLGGRRER